MLAIFSFLKFEIRARIFHLSTRINRAVRLDRSLSIFYFLSNLVTVNVLCVCNIFRRNDGCWITNYDAEVNS